MVRFLRSLLVLCASLLFLGTIFFSISSVLAPTAHAATGINSQINFQGKVVNTSGTNVTDGNYDFVFRLYDGSGGGATLLWTETWSGGNQVAVADGVFRVALGSITTLSSINFNDDSLYLSIEYNGDGEMSPRVRMSAVPYAFNAQKVGGLTVTNTTGSLTIPNGTTIAFSGANNLTFTTSALTTATLPSGTITLADLTTTQTLTNKTIGSTGLIFSGAATDIVADSGEALVFSGNAASSFSTTAGNITFAAAGSGTISQIQIGAGGAGSTTPDYFALDVKSTAGDPAGGAEGYMYYNTSDNKFRCFQGSAWTDCAGDVLQAPFSASGGIISKATSTDQTLLTMAEAGDYGLRVNTSVAPTADLVQFTNTGNGTITTAIDGLDIDFTAATGGSGETNAGAHVTITDSGDAADTLSGLQVTAGTAGGGTQYGVKVDNITGGAGTERALMIGSGWDQGLTVVDAGTNSILLQSDDADIASGITLGTTNPINLFRSATSELTIQESGGVNKFIFDTVNGPDYQGTARPTRSITMQPEYPSNVMSAFWGGGTDANISGTLTTAVETTGANEMRNYYNWTRGGATFHYFTAAVKVTLPDDFSAWNTTNALQVDINTNQTATTNNIVDVYVYLESDSAAAVTSSTNNTSSVAATWTTVTLDDSVLDDGSAPEWDAAGETATIFIRMGSRNTNRVRIGDLKLNYLAKY